MMMSSDNCSFGQGLENALNLFFNLNHPGNEGGEFSVVRFWKGLPCSRGYHKWHFPTLRERGRRERGKGEREGRERGRESLWESVLKQAEGICCSGQFR